MLAIAARRFSSGVRNVAARRHAIPLIRKIFRIRILVNSAFISATTARVSPVSKNPPTNDRSRMYHFVVKRSIVIRH